MLDNLQRKRAFNAIIMTQSLGMLASFLGPAGIFLNYFSSLGIDSSQIAFLLAFPMFASMLLVIPFAYLSDRTSKTRLSMVGQALISAGLLLIMLAGIAAATPREALLLAAAGQMVAGLGWSLQTASWFALLNPIIPEPMRGRFFGRLRLIFQLVAIVFTLAATWLMGRSRSPAVYQGLLGFVLLAMLARTYFYARIPELENRNGESGLRRSLAASLRMLLSHAGYRSFNGYFFLLNLFTVSIPMVLGLMEKDTLGFSPSQITMAGSVLIGGGAVGCWLGGRLVDRIGTRVVFVASHLAFALLLFGVLARGWMPWSGFAHMLLATLGVGLVGGMMGIAITSEILGLIPRENKSLSTAVATALAGAGAALSGMAVSWILRCKVLAAEWHLCGRSFGAYDTLLAGHAVMILLMLVTLGLVPPVAKRAQLIPQTGGQPRI